MTAIWHGTNPEMFELTAAIMQNCDCILTEEGVRAQTCASHKGLTEDQRWLDGLVYARRIAQRLREKEFLG